jgi:hypothetical protein
MWRVELAKGPAGGHRGMGTLGLMYDQKVRPQSSVSIS